MKSDYLVLMADIIKSRDFDQKNAMEGFHEIVHSVNKQWRGSLLSPLTITLGDEFQGIVRGMGDIADVVFALEEQSVIDGIEFKLRYALYQGAVDTPINKHLAYGMMGDGLTLARQRLSVMKRSSNRFHFSFRDDAKSKVINDSFLVFQSIVDKWNVDKDYYLVASFLKEQDYKDVAVTLEKDRSLMWRRMKSLQMEEYLAMKKVISYLMTGRV